MKVVLNGVISDIEGKPVTVIRYIDGVKNEIPQKFCNIIYGKALQKHTSNDADTMKYYNVAEKMYENSRVDECEIEISIDEFKIMNELILRENLIIKAKFLEMAQKLNPELFDENGLLIENEEA